MDSKKKAARFEMLKHLSRKKSSEMNEPKKGALTLKFSSKFKPSEEKEEPAKKKLTKGQEILKAKLGKLFDEDEDELEEDSDEEAHCAECEDEGCELCEEDEDADE